ncbi:Uncharacterized protein FWK35_00004437 [Aphis craccivora]|uniref:Uncharacterized protein n=1 Tax=Aphis craccivora TaxID=307492 RepID=A0A6G0YKP9_APHCR|nr:Uncharacterized protein FWK35_00004437 [Aphis craccivora]
MDHCRQNLKAVSTHNFSKVGRKYRAIAPIHTNFRHEDSRVWCLTATTAGLLLALCNSQEPRRLTVDACQGYPTNNRPRVVDGPQNSHVRPFPSKSRARPFVPLVKAFTCLSPPW